MPKPVGPSHSQRTIWYNSRRGATPDNKSDKMIDNNKPEKKTTPAASTLIASDSPAASTRAAAKRATAAQKANPCGEKKRLRIQAAEKEEANKNAAQS